MIDIRKMLFPTNNKKLDESRSRLMDNIAHLEQLCTDGLCLVPEKIPVKQKPPIVR